MDGWHKEKIKKYLDDHFQLSLDGKRLDSRLEDLRYAQGFWQPDSLSARLFFDISYTVPRQGGTLKGHVTFFQDSWDAEEKDAKAENRTPNLSGV